MHIYQLMNFLIIYKPLPWSLASHQFALLKNFPLEHVYI